MAPLLGITSVAVDTLPLVAEATGGGVNEVVGAAGEVIVDGVMA